MRPAVISKDVEKEMMEYLAFRHIVRNIYGYELDMERIRRLVSKLPPLHHRFTQHINAFIEFLRSLL
jgi:hypothetical protein